MGSILAAHVSAHVILGIFASMATAAALLLAREPPVSNDLASARMSSVRAGAIGGGVGGLSGLVGAGGAFLLVPLLVRGLHVPLRQAIGTSPLIAMGGAAAAVVARLVGGELILVLVPWLVAGTAAGAYLGSKASGRVSVIVLRRVLAATVASIAVVAWVETLARNVG